MTVIKSEDNLINISTTKKKKLMLRKYNHVSSHGHRDRLRHKFQHHADSLCDYELLELLLFLSKPMVDTKQNAKTLLEKFGNLHDVIFADDLELSDIFGIGPSSLHVIKIVKEIVIRVAKEKIANKPLLSNLSQVISYLDLVMSNKRYEHIRLLFLDIKQRLILDYIHENGDIDTVQLQIKDIVKKALVMGVAGIIVAHNHPSGNPTPSKQDIDATRSLKELLGKLNIVLYDHIIIGHNRHISMVNANLI